MIIYTIGPMDDGDLFFPTLKEAIDQAKFYGDETDMYVDAVEIGKLNKDTVCRLASNRGFALSRKKVWGSKPEFLKRSA